MRLKAPREISGRGRIRNALRSQAIQETLVLTAQLDVFQAHPSSHDVVGHIQNVIALVIGQMPLEHLDLLIQLIDQADALAKKMNSSDAPTTHGLGLLAHFIMDVAAREHRLVLFGPGTGLQAAGNSLLAVAEDLGVFSAHSKCPFWLLCLFFTTSFQPMLTGISSFLFIFCS